ncbi:uncharacterized protein LOC126798341 isoform X2 [Argentina anserina]|uniref:uncharacterized protein LOC126798341 isoform X2 n=1 Tax=Argentina anserina TaxID=57926 RepID=UPI0021761F47|nr:uncharacterized protein LOC126798341 isoform X2 [Potentilla anserina]
MMAFRSLKTIRALFRATQIPEPSYLLGSSRSYATCISNVYNWNAYSSLNKGHGVLPWTSRNAMTLRSAMAVELPIFLDNKRSLSTQVKAPAQSRPMTLSAPTTTSPGFILEPYAPREKLPFFRRWFTRSGWRRTKDDIILELRSAYAINKLRKAGYSKKLFYQEAVGVYKEINTLLANGDKKTLRKAVTEKMYSELKNEIKQRESIWSTVHWELIEPIVKIRTLRARVIGVDPKNLEKLFIQLTLEFLSKQKFEACDFKGSVVSGDKTKEVLVRDIWVFEKCLFDPKSFWRLCGRITL